eukprot:5007754-Amphidinium_carterae.1
MRSLAKAAAQVVEVVRAKIQQVRPRWLMQEEILPVMLGGYGQGGVVSLFAAAGHALKPIQGVLMCQSSIPFSTVLLSHMSSEAIENTEIHAVYEDGDIVCSSAQQWQSFMVQFGCRAKLQQVRSSGGD